jgi:hypothetical protein
VPVNIAMYLCGEGSKWIDFSQTVDQSTDESPLPVASGADTTVLFSAIESGAGKEDNYRVGVIGISNP